MNPRVADLIANDDFTLVIKFTNGEVRRYDVTPLLGEGVFTKLQDSTMFKRASVGFGTVVWPGDIDICPDTLYEDSLRIDQHNNPFHETSLRSARE